MSASHTPAPWRVSRTQSWGVTTPNDNIVRCYGNEADANARLIAAAPEMIEALKALASLAESRLPEQWQPYNGETGHPLNRARAIIARATNQQP